MAEKACHAFASTTQVGLIQALGPMYGFPRDLDLTAAIGQETTQFCVGPYDLEFSFGSVCFSVQSLVELRRTDMVLASWEGGGWPSAGFYEAFCSPVSAVRVLDERCLCISLESGLDLHIFDTSEQYESLAISVAGVEGPYII